MADANVKTAVQRAVIVERILPHAPEKIWRVLTETALIAEWMMPNDFRAETGHRFTFRTQPIGHWDGIVTCEVLACDAPHLLRYSWVSGPATSGGVPLDTVVTWTLAPADGGTRLRMEHDGFGPGNGYAYQGAKGGWERAVERIGVLAAGLE